MLYESIEHADDTVVRFGNKVCFKNSSNNTQVIILKKWGETLDYVSCFSLHFFRALAASSSAEILDKMAAALAHFLLNGVQVM